MAIAICRKIPVEAVVQAMQITLFCYYCCNFRHDSPAGNLTSICGSQDMSVGFIAS